MRKFIIAGNWKMNKSISETKAFFTELLKKLQKTENSVILAPPFLSLQSAIETTKNSTVQISSQNVHFEENGAFTGEVSTSMLKEIGVTHAIIGHSERRQYFAETDETVNKRSLTALKNGLTPIICIGETLKERESNKTNDVIKMQTENALKNFSENDLEKIVIAYEPVWAIGTGKTATPEQAQEVHAFIRKLLPENVREKIQILYGGSLKPSNAKELLSQKDIDGGLIGGASLKPSDFLEIISIADTI
jgi:triosephosphate isomerase